MDTWPTGHSLIWFEEFAARHAFSFESMNVAACRREMDCMTQTDAIYYELYQKQESEALL